MTEFIVSNLQDAAMRTIEDMQIIRLNAKESRAFAQAVLNPRAPNQKLRTAARRYMETMGK